MKKDIEAHRRIGRWVRQRRIDAGITQTGLANRIRRHRSFIAKLEAGRRVDLITLATVAGALGADLRGAVDAVRG